MAGDAQPPDPMTTMVDASLLGAVGEVPHAVATREASVRTTRVSWRRDIGRLRFGVIWVRGNLKAERRVAVHRVNRHFETKFPVFATISPRLDCTSSLYFRETS
jgi:hypothetical protein